jgi:uncharacterized protein (DUF885 family)
LRLFTLLAALALAAPIAAAPAEDLKRVLDEHWAWYLRSNPVQATELGVREHDARLGDPSLEAADREAREAQGYVERLDRIDPAGLSPTDRANRAILRRMLAEQVAGNRFGQRAVTFTTYSGWHTWFAGLPEQLPLFTRADYESYLARLAAFPAYNRAAIATTRVGLKDGYAQPCAPLEGFEKSIAAHAVADPRQSVFQRPFASRPSAIPGAEWTAIVARGEALIRGSVVPAYRELQRFYLDEYKPQCRTSVGIAETRGGRDYYAYRARVMTTTDMTPDQIHALGLSEVARIRAEMDGVVARSGFKGTRADYVRYLRTDPKLYPKSGAELLAAAGYTAKIIDGWMPRLFGRLPRLPYTVKEVPADQAEGTTTAFYQPGAAESGRAGAYYVNTSKLDQRPLFELPALTVHEAVPGHHHQIALQQELDLPMFRRHAVQFTAFTEGWGLYSERLGIEMGLYDTPEKDMGRLSYEMWRACRLVVDTGIHVKGWTRAQAIQFMLENTALSRHNIEAEVNRYITWPGQALAYKVGELAIRRLRDKATRELGAKFDLRAFHDTVLEQGPVPMDVLESNIDAWIMRTTRR